MRSLTPYPWFKLYSESALPYLCFQCAALEVILGFSLLMESKVLPFLPVLKLQLFSLIHRELRFVRLVSFIGHHLIWVALQTKRYLSLKFYLVPEAFPSENGRAMILREKELGLVSTYRYGMARQQLRFSVNKSTNSWTNNRCTYKGNCSTECMNTTTTSEVL